MPGIAHVVYIPLCLGIGFILGWKFGAGSIQARWDRAEERRRIREEEG